MYLSLGSCGKPVKAVQDQLSHLGYPVGLCDSIFGPKTERAVRAFQADEGLGIDGIVGPHTWQALCDMSSRRVVPRPTREYINQVLYGGQEVYDALDEIIAAVSRGEGGGLTASIATRTAKASFSAICSGPRSPVVSINCWWLWKEKIMINLWIFLVKAIRI